MGKKKKFELDKQFEGFQVGMYVNGYFDGVVNVLWEILLLFFDYVFNKVYFVVYGVVLYWIVYFKVYYLVEYMVVLLISVGDLKDKMVLYLNECCCMGIKVFLFDVFEFINYFVVVGDDICFGLGVVCNVGSNVVDGIIKFCEKECFMLFYYFFDKVLLYVVNKCMVELFIKVGVFDLMGDF